MDRISNNKRGVMNMAVYGLDKGRWDATPLEVKQKGLGKHPPLPREPIPVTPKVELLKKQKSDKV